MKSRKSAKDSAKADPTMPEETRVEVSEIIRKAGCGEITLEQMCTKVTAITLTKLCPPSPFETDVDHFGPMTVWDLVKLVHTDEFPEHLKTVIKLGDVEGNLDVIGSVCVTAHRPGDIVLSVDTHGGDMDYDCEAPE